MSNHVNCEGIARRDCLQWGLSTLGGLGLVDLLRARGRSESNPSLKKTSCILIWMDGGPTHFETFDPKPDAPAEIRGSFHPISTKTPSCNFSEHLPKLAAISDKFAVVRSVCHNQGNHGAGNHYMMTGAPPRIPVGCGAYVSFHPSMGSVAALERGAPAGLPAYFTLPSMTRSGGPNFLGAKYAPFTVEEDPNQPHFRVRDINLPRSITDDRFVGRLDMRSTVDRMTRYTDAAAADPAVALDEYYSQGYDLVTSTDARKAFDIHQESEKLRDLYGRNSFGQRLLLARRLVEAGVPFITLHDGGWDHHSSLFDALTTRLPNWDNSVATLIEDLDQRGLLETTMVIALGEFGRTPQLSVLSGQTKAGRDHWSNSMSILFAGCQTPGGIVVGQTDRRGYAPIERVLSPENFVSTVYSKLGIDPATIYHHPSGRPVSLVSDPTPIAELMSS